MRYVIAVGLLALMLGCGDDCAKCGEPCGVNYGEQVTWCDRNLNCVNAGGNDSGPPPSLCNPTASAANVRR